MGDEILDGPERPIFGPRFTLALVVGLLLPFAVKSVVWAEPWPAVIFPSGASKVAVRNGVVTFDVVTVEARSGVESRRMSPVQLISPIPAHYLELMLRHGLGQDSRPYRELIMKRGGRIWRLPRVPPTSEERRAAQRWFNDRVRATGFEADSVSVRSDVITVDMSSGREIARQHGDDVLVPLR